ncbi:potassium-transporting ATPase subunit C, partial [Salmonella enterica subsp. enterica serovar Dublin]|nr:potassium-transporting ATPase subunit C [Salmonella enterica subsp. enterica serovar Dublin]
PRRRASDYYPARVAAARQLPVEQVAQLVAEYTHRPLARFLGQPVVNIVELNLALDARITLSL